MARQKKTSKRATVRSSRSVSRSKLLKTKAMSRRNHKRKTGEEMVDPLVQAQMKLYEEGVRLFQQQKFHKALQALEKVIAGPSSEIADRARIHIRICQQRIERAAGSGLKSAEDYYHHGIAMMNLGRWDDARESLEKARKMASKADYIHYAMAALDCLVGEADSALANLKVAIELRPENRYHARNDEDFSSLFEDPRFTELLYPEREGSAY